MEAASVIMVWFEARKILGSMTRENILTSYKLLKI
jgi:hypothetical protein